MELPKIGDIKVQIREGSNGTFIVQVDEFKENTLRGDAYWVTICMDKEEALAVADAIYKLFKKN